MKQVLTIGITCYPSIGGSGIVATELGNELARRGHNVHFITYEKPFRMDPALRNVFFHKVKVNEYALFKYPDYSLPLAVKMAEVAQMHHLDLFHVHYAVPHATAALLARAMARACRMCAPLVFTTLHGTDITMLGSDANLQPAIKYSIEKSDGVTAVSRALARDTKKLLHTKKPIQVIYNFYEPKPITIPREKVRKNLKIKDDEFILIHMSNLRGVKRIEDLLYILARVPKKAKAKLLILSAGDFSGFMALARKLKVHNNIIVKSKVFDIENYINAADAGIYTSETESFGMGILETSAYGKPVLATRAGGVPEVVAHKKTGLLFSVGDIEGFAKGVNLLASDKKLAADLGKNAQMRARKFFCAEKIVTEYEKYYYKIMQASAFNHLKH